jgi:hypothetical protein
MATTTNYSWTTPDNAAYVKDGASAIRTLGSSVDTTLFTALGGAYPGLRLIKKQTIGSGVSSVSVTDAFSATYDNYKIIISGGVGSTADNIGLTLGSSTADYNATLIYTTYASSTVLSANLNAASSWSYAGSFDTTQIRLNMDLVSAFLAKPTLMSGSFISGSAAGSINGRHNVSTSYTAFTITCGAGNLTGGTIYVYGYGAS